MNEFMDFELGLMVALPEVAGCSGCAYDNRPCPDVVGIGSYCSRDTRGDGRGIIWVRDIERAVLRANNLETPE